MWEGYEKVVWPDLRCESGICLDGRCKSAENLSQDNLSSVLICYLTMLY